MPSAYEQLVKSGFVGSLKRDVLLEASVDLEYVGAIRSRFANAGDHARREAVTCTVQLISELIAKDLCSLATWSKVPDSGPVVVTRSHRELECIVAESSERDHTFEFFLLSTAAGDHWVGRYEALVGEL